MLTNVEKTCLMTCQLRCSVAKHSSNPLLAPLDASFDEKAISLLLTPEERVTVVSSQVGNGAVLGKDGCWITARGLELDRLALAASPKQIVLLGCGMDCRPWRVKWPQDCHVFEVDTQQIIAMRDVVAAHFGAPTHCHRSAVACDLSDWSSVEAGLLAAGFDRSVKTAWIAEGLVGYLTQAVMLGLFQGTRQLSSPGSVLVMTAPPSPENLAHAQATGCKLFHTTFEHTDQTVARAKSASWTDIQVLKCSEIASRYSIEVPRFDQDIILCTAN